EADHVDHDIELPPFQRPAKLGRIIAITGDRLQAGRQRVLALAAVEYRHVGLALQQVLDDPPADEPRSADHQNAHAPSPSCQSPGAVPVRVPRRRVWYPPHSPATRGRRKL